MFSCQSGSSSRSRFHSPDLARQIYLQTCYQRSRFRYVICFSYRIRTYSRIWVPRNYARKFSLSWCMSIIKYRKDQRSENWSGSYGFCGNWSIDAVNDSTKRAFMYKDWRSVNRRIGNNLRIWVPRNCANNPFFKLSLNITISRKVPNIWELVRGRWMLMGCLDNCLDWVDE